MKRVILATVATTIALVALLSFKSHPAQQSATAALPSATLASTAATTTTAAPTPRPPASSSGPPNQSTTTTKTTPATTPPSTPASAATRTVLGSTVHTRYGIVQVKVVVAAKRITAVSFAQLTAFDGRSAQINSQAGPQLLQQTLTAQSAHVDGVSGATYTSDGYRTSLQNALDQVGIR